MKVDLAEFMRTGIFGVLRLGLDLNQVTGMVGPAEDETPEHVSPAIWKFGATELMFEHGRLISIEQKLIEDGSWPTIAITPQSLAFARSLRASAVSDGVRQIGARILELRKPSYAPEDVILILEHQVRLAFHDGRATTVSVLSLPPLFAR